MLHTQTVQPATLELLKRLLAIPELDGFALVGGTNLALQLGHRLSIDLDLFTNKPFSLASVKDAIHLHFPGAIQLDEMKQTLWYQIDGVKTDIVLHEYPYLQPIQNIADIRLLSMTDIIPMKLGAVSGRGAKKDFWDIAVLLDLFSIEQMLDFYKRKYTSDDLGFIIRSLVYFEDAELQSDPVSLNNVTWPDVKSKIAEAVKRYVKNNTK